MNFTDTEIVEIEELCKVNVLVKKMWSAINEDDSDVGEKFLKSIRASASAISKELDAIHSGGYSNFKILNSKPHIYKRVFQLLANSGKIVDNLNGVKKEDVSTKQMKADKENEISLTDRLANELKK